MADDFERMREAFRAIARDDEADALRASPRIEAALVAELRSRRGGSSRAGVVSRIVGLGIAAVLAVSLARSMWLAGRGSHAGVPLPSSGAGAVTEVGTAFM